MCFIEHGGPRPDVCADLYIVMNLLFDGQVEVRLWQLRQVALVARYANLHSFDLGKVVGLGVAPAVLFVFAFVKRSFFGSAFEKVRVLHLAGVIEDLDVLNILAVIDVGLRVGVGHYTGVDEIDTLGIEGVADPVVRKALNPGRCDTGNGHHSCTHWRARGIRPSDARVGLRGLRPNNPRARPVAADHRCTVLVV